MEKYEYVKTTHFPRQNLPFNKKGKKWRKQCVDWAADKSYFNYEPVRNSVIHKKINYDLLNGILHMEDMEYVLNPENIKSKYNSNKIQHFPIINSKLEVLRGEGTKRLFEYRVVITNPNSLSRIEENKKQEWLNKLQEEIADTSLSDEEFLARVEKLNQYYNYEWKDLREINANYLLKQYIKELDAELLFHTGFMDAVTVGEELYLCDIVSGEPTLEKLNPMKVRVFRSGYSNKIEDADIVVLEDYWSISKIIENYYESLSEKDIKYLENLPYMGGDTDSLYNEDATKSFINKTYMDLSGNEFFFGGIDGIGESSPLSPYDLAGNVRVMRIFWKSKRRVKKVKSYDPETGEEIFNFYPETYKANAALGEEEESLYINEAWEGTLIGKNIYVNMRPRLVQYNRLSNPSRCHFGIIGTIYNLNDNKPFSLVDMAKPFSYLYDAVHDRLNKTLAKNWGKLIKLDLAKVPRDWKIDKWLHYAKTAGIIVEDSFKEGNVGAATGKLAGGLNNASSGVIDAEMGNHIQNLINLLEYIKIEMSEVMGISKQREGQVSNRETFGGIERATLQSSHITEWLFTLHENTKKRVLECLLETAKIALKGRSKKFQYITPDNLLKVFDINGDDFAEADYGLLIDGSSETQELKQNLSMLAQAAMQAGKINFSTYMKLFNTTSMAEKQRMVEQSEQQIEQQRQKESEQQSQIQQYQIDQNTQLEQAKLQQNDIQNQRDNETKIITAQIQAQNKGNMEAFKIDDDVYSQEEKDELNEKIRQFNERLKFDKQKHKDDIAIKNKQIAKQNNKQTK